MGVSDVRPAPFSLSAAALVTIGLDGALAAAGVEAATPPGGRDRLPWVAPADPFATAVSAPTIQLTDTDVQPQDITDTMTVLPVVVRATPSPSPTGTPPTATPTGSPTPTPIATASGNSVIVRTNSGPGIDEGSYTVPAGDAATTSSRVYLPAIQRDQRAGW